MGELRLIDYRRDYIEENSHINATVYLANRMRF